MSLLRKSSLALRQCLQARSIATLNRCLTVSDTCRVPSALSLSPSCNLTLIKWNFLSTKPNENIKERIASMVKDKPIVLFIKGTAEQPRCGFSKAVVDIMSLHGAAFESHNVLEDEQIRSGIKEYSNWPTIPQIFFKGEFIGGCDILLEMHRSGELIEELKKIGIQSKLADEEEEKK